MSDPKPTVRNDGGGAYAVLTPPRSLAPALAPDRPGGDLALIARAEKSLQGLSGNFSQWMADDVEALNAAHREMGAEGVSPETLQAIFNGAHAIRGNAATLGFPRLGTAAGILCDLIENHPDLERLSQPIVDSYVYAIGALFREERARASSPILEKLVASLRELAATSLAREAPQENAPGSPAAD